MVRVVVVESVGGCMGGSGLLVPVAGAEVALTRCRFPVDCERGAVERGDFIVCLLEGVCTWIVGGGEVGRKSVASDESR